MSVQPGSTPITKIYAELISDHPLPLDIPPLKVLINQQIATTTADSLRNSSVIAHNLAKSMILDVLTQQNIKSFGKMSQRMLGLDYTLQSTRGILFWSLRFPAVENVSMILIKSSVHIAVSSTYDHLQSVIVDFAKEYGKAVTKQNLLFCFNHHSWIIDPLVQQSLIALPKQKVRCKNTNDKM